MAKGLGGSTTLLVLGILVVGFGIFLFTGKHKGGHGKGHHKPPHKKAFFVHPHHYHHRFHYGLGGHLYYPETSDVSLLYGDY